MENAKRPTKAVSDKSSIHLPYRSKAPAGSMVFDAETLSGYGLSLVTIDGGFAVRPERIISDEGINRMREALNFLGLTELEDHQATMDFLHHRLMWAVLKMAIYDAE